MFHFVELHIGNSIRYNTLFGNCFIKCNKIKRILILTNCFFLSILERAVIYLFQREDSLTNLSVIIRPYSWPFQGGSFVVVHSYPCIGWLMLDSVATR